MIQELKRTGISSDDEAVIIRGRSGYELAGWIRTAKTAVSPSNPPVELPPEDRQKWFLEQIQKRKLTRSQFEQHFKISPSTSKRDLRALEGQVEFVGTGKKGVLPPQTQTTSGQTLHATLPGVRFERNNMHACLSCRHPPL